MSVATVTAIEEATVELGASLEGASSTLLGAAGSAFWPIAIVTAAAESVNLFGKLWNKNRAQIPQVLELLRAADTKLLNLGRNVFIPTTDAVNKVINSEKLIRQSDLIKKIFNVDIKGIADDLYSKFNKLSFAIGKQLEEIIRMFVEFSIAMTNNTFYTLNRGRIDNLINAYTSGAPDIDAMVAAATAAADAINKLLASVQAQYDRAAYITVTVLAPPTRTAFPTLNLNELENFDLEGWLKRIMEILAAITLTKLKFKRFKIRRPKKKKLPKKVPPKKPTKKTPEYIRSISVNTPSSNWIKKITFTFPAAEKIYSDRKGTIRFFLKKGGVIKRVRVNRGTFSTIAMWSTGTKLGAGYRYWSQFNKARIVNKKVFSYSIARINAQDREIAIPLEIAEKRVKYN